jgi:hypothetical protein
MTEPDEALIAFRKWAFTQDPKWAQQHAAGQFDTSASGVCFSAGYRAGQAASAERIKALEEALLNLVDRVTEDDGEGCQTSVNAAEMISARVVLRKEADQ